MSSINTSCSQIKTFMACSCCASCYTSFSVGSSDDEDILEDDEEGYDFEDPFIDDTFDAGDAGYSLERVVHKQGFVSLDPNKVLTEDE